MSRYNSKLEIALKFGHAPATLTLCECLCELEIALKFGHAPARSRKQSSPPVRLFRFAAALTADCRFRLPN